ncbi:unnamed protein product [Xylocopa violacea]|uniref:Uncharacterized protein n=1 Tax=Xylocopa violacea TaxID=135666 RepID=A0ABP1NEU4_XYLVO
MSNSTLEKLLGILRNKMIGTADQSTTPGLVNAKRVRNALPSSVDEEDEGEEDEGDHGKGMRRGEEEDDGNVDVDARSTCKEKLPEWFSMIENGIKLSGPVTDL